MTSWSSSRRASVRHLARSFHTLMRQSCEQLANNSSPPEGVIERTWKPSRDFIQSSAFDSDSNPLFSDTLLNLILATSLSRTGRRWRSQYDSRRRLGAASQVENKAHDPVSEYPPICCMMHFKLNLTAYGPDLAKINMIKKDLLQMGRGSGVITCGIRCFETTVIICSFH